MRKAKFGGWARFLLTACAILVAAVAVAAAQSPDGLGPAAASPSVADIAPPSQTYLDLPNAPGPSFPAPVAPAPVQPPEASPSRHDIDPGQASPVLTPHQKIVMGLRGSFSPFAATGWIFASGYEQLTNGAPNWGTDSGAYGQRLGDAALRGLTEDLLRGCVMMPLLREDPRYYRLGSSHKALARVLYAVTRPLITRTDSGREVPNFALLSGNLAGAALTNAYYPRSSRSAALTFATFGGGLAGAAIGNGIAEFLSPLLNRRFHLSR